ncbi:MAG TPA: hypothetical protein PK217_00520 [Sphingopyxis terrae]|uniref:hypothetical protein n=1 Tax=uncultured Sphingopyxis sp. TaxID=310581 RepID=UPI002596C6C4|nr:hypothetical protein [uncultured Sphingopyxis sp.]HRE33538.1 hypothetical protein [Sphingopyxis terrae]
MLELLANNRTSKEIAGALAVSEPAINRRIEVLRLRLGGITRHELVRRYRNWRDRIAPDAGSSVPCVENDDEFIQLGARAAFGKAGDGSDADETTARFRDSIAVRVDAPWAEEMPPPRVVPGMLDGSNAMLSRGAAIAIILLAILASLAVGLGVARALADIVNG